MKPRLRPRLIPLGLIPLLAVALILTGCSKQGTRLSIATGGTTGVYYVYGGGYAKIISSNMDGVEATASAADAVQGKESFGSPQPLRALARIYDNYTQLAATRGSGVKRVSDLKGKRVGIGAPNSGTLVIAQRLLAAAGINPSSDIKAQRLGINESVQAMKDGTIDAFFWSGGVPTAGITDLTSTKKDTTLVDTTDLLPALQQKYGNVYREITITGSAYGLPSDVKTIGVANYLMVSEKMSEDLAYDLTKVLFDRKADLQRVHPEAKNLDKQVAQQVAPTRLHPGAQRYLTGG